MSTHRSSRDSATQINPEECCFIDDRAPNLECAAKLGMHTIELQTLEQLREGLRKLGLDQPQGIGQRSLA
jgi:FMN phosphatase YigB (HAD superfamily)